MKKISTKSKVTIDKLAIMVAKGFESVDNKLSRFENAFTALSNRVDGLHEDVVHIKTTLGPLAKIR